MEFFNLYDKSPETLWELRSIGHRVSKQKLMDRKTHAGRAGLCAAAAAAKTGNEMEAVVGPCHRRAFASTGNGVHM